jgi:UDP-N-acetylmuramoylalanine--D-glutamate ligase
LSSATHDDLVGWSGPWAGKRAIVVGLGATGFAVVDTLVELKVDVLAVADKAQPDVVGIAEVLGASLVISEDANHRVQAGLEYGADFAVVSPGIAADDPVAVALATAGIPVWSDLDFAWRVRDKTPHPAPWVLVVGSAHSAKIADLATRILVAEGHRARHVGWEVAPVLDALRDPEPYSTLVISASDESVHWWKRYPEALRRPYLSVSIDSDDTATGGTRYDGTTLACVYRRGVGDTEAMVLDAEVIEGARAIGIGLDSPGMSDVGLVEGILCDRAFLDDRANQALEISTVEELREAGWSIPEELPEILAAIAIARAFDVSPPLIAGVLSLP